MTHGLVVLLLVPGALTHASELRAVAREGEDFGALAERTLGDAGLGELLSSHNGVRRLEVGSEVSLPAARRHRVVPGQSWEDLARRYWGDPDLGAYLALFSGHPASEPPPVGDEILIPALARYRLQPGDTLARLARVFLRDVAFAQPLAGLNRFENPRRLGVGTPVLVPVRNPALPQPGSDDAVRGTSDPVATPGVSENDARHDASVEVPGTASNTPPVGAAASSEHTERLLQAVNLYLDGDFEVALERLEALRQPVLESGSQLDRALLLRHLIYVYVAFDRGDDACVMHDALLAVEDEPEWNPDLVSPRILQAIRGCPARVSAP